LHLHLPQDNIPPEVIEALQPLLAHVDFQPAKIKKVSQAAFGLCSWVRAMDTYNKVAKVRGARKWRCMLIGSLMS
jgi:dynein heavy chain